MTIRKLNEDLFRWFIILLQPVIIGVWILMIPLPTSSQKVLISYSEMKYVCVYVRGVCVCSVFVRCVHVSMCLCLCVRVCMCVC